MSDETETPNKLTRQQFLSLCGRGTLLLLLGGGIGGLTLRRARAGTLWQIDPNRCIQCGQCATHCVLEQSAVKCFHTFQMCGYCELCTGFFGAQPNVLDEGAENQICPVGAIKRRYVDDPYFEYQIDEARCIGCGRCVKGCKQFGNGSLYLQIRHNRCLNCNECSIARVCAGDAIHRVPADRPYLLKTTVSH
jgi:electron transport complex protein RnfB